MKNWSEMLLASLLCASAGLNVVQMKELGELRKTSDPGLAPGDAAPPLSVRGGGNRETRIDTSGKTPTLLYVFSPECGWCESNLDNIRAAAAQANGRYEVVGLSLSREGFAEFGREKGFDFPVYGAPDKATFAAYEMGSTPQTVLIASGRVEASWRGAWTGPAAAEIEQRLGVRLPGLRKSDP